MTVRAGPEPSHSPQMVNGLTLPLSSPAYLLDAATSDVTKPETSATPLGSRKHPTACLPVKKGWGYVGSKGLPARDGLETLENWPSRPCAIEPQWASWSNSNPRVSSPRPGSAAQHGEKLSVGRVADLDGSDFERAETHARSARRPVRTNWVLPSMARRARSRRGSARGPPGRPRRVGAKFHLTP